MAGSPCGHRAFWLAELAEDHFLQGLFVLGRAHYLARTGRGQLMADQEHPPGAEISRVLVPRRCRSFIVVPWSPGATE